MGSADALQEGMMAPSGEEGAERGLYAVEQAEVERKQQRRGVTGSGAPTWDSSERLQQAAGN